MSTIQYLKTFTAVVEEGSFTAASEKLNLSKPVVSKQISQLEETLGVQLIVRTTRSLSLTEAGEAFAAHALKIMSDLREAEYSVMPMQNEPRGTLSISAPQSLAYSILPKILPVFQKEHPLITLDIKITGRFSDLIEDGIDVALRIGKLKDSSLLARLIAPCPLKVCASPEYWKKQGKPTHPIELTQHNCLIYKPGTRSGQWRFEDEKGETLNVKVSGNLRTDEGGLLLGAAISGQGVMNAPSFYVEEALEKGLLEMALSEFTRKDTGVYAVYPSSKHISSKLRVFIDFLVSAM